MSQPHPAWSIVELAVYGAVAWVLMDPNRADELAGRLARARERLQFKVDTWDTLEQIRSLPEKKR